MWQPMDGGRKGGVDIGPLLEGVKSTLEEQTWQMWATHTAMELELWLLQHGMEFVSDHVFWVLEGERVVEQEGEQEAAEEHRVLEEVREDGETME